MMKTRLEWKVGLFVLLGLILLGVLLLQFSKGLTFFRPTYNVMLHAADISGLKKNASVLMSGVQVGTASEIRLAPDGKSVTITLKIFSQYAIHRDAKFAIEQSGFLGDQYVAIRPGSNAAGKFGDGDVAEAEKPFSLQEIIGSSSDFIDRIGATIQRLDESISNLNRSVLSPTTLTNLSLTVTNLRALSERANISLENLNRLIDTNSPAIKHAVSNVVLFSENIQGTAQSINALLATNSPAIDRAVKNVESSMEILNSMMADVRSGKGTVGNLLNNDQMATNLAQITANLSITSSNLNRLGLWGILWERRQPKTPSQTFETLQAPKHPFN